MKPSLFYTLILSLIILCSCSSIQENKSIILAGEWKFRKAGDTEWLSATVPGKIYKISYSGITEDLLAELKIQCVNELK
ncbi:MAG: hypothetical protein D4R64_09750 [Porphyromonadaceae bacterium]|nr:MAG: hypothetical protein D4R64_09750 [Porphyromonadaceae bacterium]